MTERALHLFLRTVLTEERHSSCSASCILLTLLSSVLNCSVISPNFSLLLLLLLSPPSVLTSFAPPARLPLPLSSLLRLPFNCSSPCRPFALCSWFTCGSVSSPEYRPAFWELGKERSGFNRVKVREGWRRGGEGRCEEWRWG